MSDEASQKKDVKQVRNFLKQIAEQIRAVPGKNCYNLRDAENLAGRLLAEAMKHGAFAGLKHLHLRTLIDDLIEKRQYSPAFGSAVIWFKKYEPHWPAVAAWRDDIGSEGLVVNGCPLLADAIEAEADAIDADLKANAPEQDDGKATGLSKASAANAADSQNPPPRKASSPVSQNFNIINYGNMANSATGDAKLIDKEPEADKKSSWWVRYKDLIIVIAGAIAVGLVTGIGFLIRHFFF